tara:strand:- start:1504 stop:1731 length:228 start_codon:yes stop_codon:yes gene_type:complete
MQREDLQILLEENLREVEWRLFDVEGLSKSTIAILKTPLADYLETLSIMNKNERFETITSSGKIRLVRERIKSNS